MDNKLYYGDNLDVLDHHVDSGSVDLIYLDPPFKSDEDYNVLFETRDGSRAPAQIQAFEDTWRWDQRSAEAFYKTVEDGPAQVAKTMRALRQMIGENDMLAYLSMMAPRLVELKRVLKDTGSIFLHCDDAASHFLKMLLNSTFGPDNFRNEIIWRNYSQKNVDTRFGSIHQSIFFYSKTDDYYFEQIYRPYTRRHVRKRYRKDDQGRWQETIGGNILTGPGATDGESGEEWRGVDPTDKDRHWAVPQVLKEKLDEDIDDLSVTEQLEKLYQAGYIGTTESAYWPKRVIYLEDKKGNPVQDIWAYQPGTEGTLHGTEKGIDEDVKWIPPTSDERLNYPTQKPVGLLDRIIRAACPEDGVIMDPFCGCGTAVASAEKLGRDWIGIDITHIAISLVRHRLQDSFDDPEFEVVGEPETLTAARKLANQDRFQFQYWALGLVGARPHREEEERGPDQGIDGRLFFRDDPNDGVKEVVISVKSGENVGVGDVRDLSGVVSREDAEIGVFITLEPPTPNMENEAASHGFYRSKYTGQNHPSLQILTVEDLLNGEQIDMPPIGQVNQTFEEGPSSDQAQHEQMTMELDQTTP